MSAGGDRDHATEAAIASVYRGPLEEFVGRRDSLARELRSSGDRESASAVKALRKPSRLAWALDLPVLENPNTIDALVAAIREAVAGQSSSADVRASIGSLRTAVREFAFEAARAAGNSGHDLDVGVLVAALSAVLGNSESFDQLCRGRLADVPEAGGLDLLGSLPALPSADSPPPPTRSSTDRSAAVASPEGDSGRATPHAAAEKAAAALASAREHSAKAMDDLRDAEARVSAAEASVRVAEKEARDARSRLDRARQNADAAAAKVESAQAVSDHADRQLKAT